MKGDMRKETIEAGWRYLRDLIGTPLDAPAPEAWVLFLDADSWISTATTDPDKASFQVVFARMGSTAEEE